MQKILYKKDTKGKIRVLKIFTNGDEMVQESGLLEGATVQHRKTCKGKNIGRSNQTTPEEQAMLEVQSKSKSKQDEGYFESLEDAQEKKVILPMLAKSWDDEKDKIEWSGEVFIQPKLDGMRCLTFIKGGNAIMMSRKGKIIDTCGHIARGLRDLPEIILDGELYAHGKSFQDNMRLIKKYRPQETEQVCYHVYDSVSDDPFIKRFYDAIDLIADGKVKHVDKVDTRRLSNASMLWGHHFDYISNGYEGTMVRWGDVGYKVNGRSSNLLKYKDFKDRACEVLDIVPSEARPSQGVLVCNFGGQQFKASYKNSFEERESILANKEKYIGEFAEIRYFELTDGGVPRFPVCVGFRLDK